MASYNLCQILLSILVFNLQSVLSLPTQPVINQNETTFEVVDSTTPTPEDIQGSVSVSPAGRNSDVKQDRVQIHYDATDFKEIDHDVLQVIGDPSRLSLSCHSERDSSSVVYWLNHGTGQLDLMVGGDNDVHFNLSSGPPTLRMECVLEDNPKIRNNTWIYTGDGKAPYLFRNGSTLKANVVNESIAILPCVVNYPLDNFEDKELELFKNGQLVENKNNCLNFTPEHGYFLNLTKLEDPLGTYECRVRNSTEEDYVLVEVNQASFIHVEFQGYRSFFFERDPSSFQFECSAPRSMFNDDLNWFYKLRNGSYFPVEGPIKKKETELAFSQKIRLSFPTKEITEVVCVTSTKDTSQSFNNSVPVIVKEPQEPQIVNNPDTELKPITYTKGTNLTCAAIGTPLQFRWFKDGQIVRDLNRKDDYTRKDFSKSVLFLDPSADDEKSVYTCQAMNFLNKTANFSFLVQLKDDEDQGVTYAKFPMVELVIGLVAVVLILGFFLTFFKVRVSRRFNADKIRQFFEGHQSSQSDFEKLNEYESLPFDQSKSIAKNAVIFVKELKGGNFGTVHFGFLKAKNNSIEDKMPIAIKTIRDNPDATVEEVELAFENFLREIKLVQFVGQEEHPNIVKYIGAMTQDLGKFSAYLVVEFCNAGDLGAYIKMHRDRNSFHDDFNGEHQTHLSNYNFVGNNGRRHTVLKTSHLMKWAEEIAAGMEFVASKNILHMDLGGDREDSVKKCATRNVLLHCPDHFVEGLEPDPGRLVAKISDFGLSRALDEQAKSYYEIVICPESGKNLKRALPLRWLSPESLKTFKFSTENDVWAAGVTFWEMFTLGLEPYHGLHPIDGNLRSALITYLDEGNTLNEPDYAPQEMWVSVIRECWCYEPSERPTFREIRASIHEINETWRNEMERNVQHHQQLASGYSSVAPVVGYNNRPVLVHNKGYSSFAIAMPGEKMEDACVAEE